ncbi:MAG: tryptophan synthase subunit alpha [Candidatus Omnitrophota bacterium]
MNRIEKKFRDLKRNRQKALIVYITAGDPDMATTRRLIKALGKSGADIIELGIPFSDPLADGPTIQAASQRALKKGASMRDIMRMVKLVRRESDIPIVFMSYFNPVLQYGLQAFINDAQEAGVDGLIIPDLPQEESGAIIGLSSGHGFSVILLAAPTSTDKRLKAIGAKSKGFIYYVSLTGVTGARARLPKNIIANVRKLKKMTRRPVCVGFGVSTRRQAKMIASIADGVIIGSAVIKVIEANAGKKDMVEKAAKFVADIAKGVKS